MRDIKLKVLDATTGTLIGYELANETGWFRSVNGEKWTDDTFNFESSDESDAIRVEFTGLYDSTGREIYEGDIIKYKDTESLYAVTFYNGGFVFDSGESPTIEMRYWNIHPHNLVSRVVGNIISNSEILNKKEMR